MTNDPIVDEIRGIRETIAKECNYDIRLITQRARVRMEASGTAVVSFASAGGKDVPVASVAGGGDDNVIDAEFEKK